MKKLQILGSALVAVFTFSAFTAVAALAGPEWLDNGAPITSAIKVLFELMSGFLLEDMGNGTEVECTMANGEGTVGPGEADKVTTTECLAKKVSALCEEPPAVKINAVGLPWATKPILVEEGGVNMYRDLFTNTSLGYEIECKTIIGTVKDICTGLGFSLLIENDGMTGTVLSETDATTETESENTRCSVSGGIGLVLAGADVLIVSDEGLDIAVSG